MKKLITVSIVISVLALTGCKSTQQKVNESLDTNVIDINDSVLKMSRAVVLQTEPIKVTAEQILKNNNKGGQGLIAAGALTAASSRHHSGNQLGGAMALVGLGMMIYDAAKAEELFDATKYTIETRTGELYEVFQVDQQPIVQGSPVFVKRYTSGKVRISLDTTQGVVLQRTQRTQYSECDQVCQDEKFAREQVKRAIEAKTKQAELKGEHGNVNTININTNDGQ